MQMGTRIYSLSIHADYRCGHSGACCTSGWPIPVEQPTAERLAESIGAGRDRPARAAVARRLCANARADPADRGSRGNAGRRTRRRRRRLRVLRTRQRAMRDSPAGWSLASARRLPAVPESDARRRPRPLRRRVALLPDGRAPVVSRRRRPGDRGVTSRLPGRFRVRPARCARRASAAVAAGRAAGSGGVRSLGERGGRGVCPGGSHPEAALQGVARFTEVVRTWKPGGPTLASRIDHAVEQTARDLRHVPPHFRPATVRRHYDLVLGAIPDGCRPEIRLDGIIDAWHDRVAPGWHLFSTPVRRYLAAKAFASLAGVSGARFAHDRVLARCRDVRAEGERGNRVCAVGLRPDARRVGCRDPSNRRAARAPRIPGGPGGRI